MADLIDRNAVLAEIGEFQIRFNETGDSHERVAYASAEHCMLVIKAAHAVKAEPVRHGRWILCEDQHGVDNDNNNYAYFCSQCHYQDVHSKYAKVNFCWNCGADMREGGADNG